MSARITKAQLAAENAALRRDIAQITYDLEVANEALRVARGERPIPKFLRRELPAHMQAAKDMAMRAGIVVKVSS